MKEAYCKLQGDSEDSGLILTHAEITNTGDPPLPVSDAPETEEHPNGSTSPEIKLYEAQVRTIFDLRALGCLSKPQSPLATVSV